MERTRPTNEEASFCAKCGHENLYYSLRCTRCGTALPSGANRGERARPPTFAAFGRVVGHGAFSTVYRIQDGDETLAVKVFARNDLATRSHVDREIGALTRIDHAGVARLVAAGSAGDAAYIAMPFYDGPTLRAVLDALALQRAGLELDVVLHVAAGLAAALDAIHASGFVHRDVKPENVIVTADGPVLVDFGFAERLVLERGAPSVRRSDRPRASERPRRVAGTLPYIAPEHLAGGPAAREADLFSLGVVLFEMLSGRPPFGDENVVRSVLGGRPGALPATVPADVSALTLGLLQRDPDARPTSAARWLRDLARDHERPRPSRRGRRLESVARA